MKKRVILLLSLLVGFILLFASQVQAQTAEWEVAVDKQDATTDDRIRLSVIIHNATTASEPLLPALADFQVLASSRSSQMSIVNGNLSSQIVYLYTLRPISTGTLVIDPIAITIDGQNYQSPAILVRVEQGTQPINPNMDPSLAALSEADFYMEALVDNAKPYVGQQIIYRVRAYLREGLRLNAPYELPEFNNFWRYGTEQTDNRDIVETANGRFHIFEFDTILFPLLAGEQMIAPTIISTAGAMERDNLHTEPITLAVQPLPQPAPDGFQGVVGQFALTAVADKTAVAVGDSINLRVTLTGIGNFQTLPEPLWPELDDWRILAGDSSLQMAMNNGRLHGQRIYQRILIPNSGGNFTLPPIEYTYFNPDTAQYETASTPPIPVTVSGSAAASASDGAASLAEPVGNDIQPIKPAPSAFASRSSSLPHSPLYWLLWSLPLLLLVAYLSQSRHQQRNAAYVGGLEAVKLAMRNLETEKDGYTAVQQAITSYLTHKLEQPIAGLTQKQLGHLLQKRGLDAALAEQVIALLHWSEIGRFSPISSNSEVAESVAQAKQLIAEMDKAL